MQLGLLNLSATATLPRSTAMLSEAEMLRAKSMQRPLRRQQFLAGRRLAQHLLQQRQPQQDWLLTAAQGEPVRIIGHPDLHLSISHSGTWVACVLADFEIGIDIETIRLSRPIDEMAQWVCSGQERLAMAQHAAPEQRLTAFLHFWCLKEAWLKQHNTPLSFAQMRALDAAQCPAGTACAASWTDKDRNLVIALAAAAGRFSHALPCPPQLPAFWHVSNTLAPGIGPVPQCIP